MKKSVKSWIINLIIIIAIISIYLLLAGNKTGNIDKKVVQCIGENSELYIQLGCHACESQKELFGENYKYLNITDCYFENEKCLDKEISATPTWIINKKKYIGVQSIDKLKNLTGCS